MSIPDFDFETAALIAQLALEDLEGVKSGRKGKGRADSPLTDEEYAHDLQREHYSQLLAISEDAKFAKSIADALASDGAYIEALTTAELAAADDRQAAEMLSRDERLPPPNAVQSRLEDKTFTMHPEPTTDSTVASDTASECSSETETVIFSPGLRSKISSSTSSGNRPFQRVTLPAGPSIDRNKIVHCTICFDDVNYANALHTQCDHHYCRHCVQDLAENFTRDESLYPLRCCNEPIPVGNVHSFISVALRTLFQAKHAEFSVLSKDRIYCVNPTCSKFLGSSEETDSWSTNICPDCFTSTCPRCKQAAHVGEDCTVNAAAVELRAMARREGWQTCPGCHTLIELNLGCYHMTCRCRTQFCYLCAERWKNCTCPQWDEDRLIATAQQRVENELGPRAIQNVAPAVFQHQVQERARTLRYNHHCDVHSWRRRNGGGTCEECHWYLRDYLLV
ncbi:hypothetical protein CVT26_016128 [Gymnopilus dilepis]|uniref:RBR-type E3 ubiquitin transferase n=1 Tax=Gymnopilus dilepis TaxID=231916 RepID=A0A409XYW8_9AGAR|nr:hypothetical protein CVT26_016128 [Gymnopilus dilepis]